MCVLQCVKTGSYSGQRALLCCYLRCHSVTVVREQICSMCSAVLDIKQLVQLQRYTSCFMTAYMALIPDPLCVLTMIVTLLHSYFVYCLHFVYVLVTLFTFI